MEDLLVLIGFWCGLFFIIWIIRTISKFLETLKYKTKLKKIAPRIKSINTEKLSAELLSIEKSYSELINKIQKRYGAADEQWTNIRRYQEEKALYKNRRIGGIR
jgi:hypothetical protein